MRSHCRARLLTLPIALVLLLLGVLSAWAADITPALQTRLLERADDDAVSVLAIMSDQADLQGLDRHLRQTEATRAERHEAVVKALQASASSQADLLHALEDGIARGSVGGYTSYWITNAVVIEATKAEVIALSGRADIASLDLNFQPELIEPSLEPMLDNGLNDRDTIEHNIETTRADEVWNTFGVTGAGALVANLDTGVMGTHPYLDEKWRGYGGAHPASECWLDLLQNPSSTPEDCNSDYGHGTVTMGLMVGQSGTHYIGMAPDAQWIACQGIGSSYCPGYQYSFDNTILAAYQWFADPDGNPATVDDVPDVVNNSWRLTLDCYQAWSGAIYGAEYAGVVTIWGAGNEGFANNVPVWNSVGSPAEIPYTQTSMFAVGAVKTWIDEWNDGIFPHPIWVQWAAPQQGSSRGPSNCSWASGGLEIKPEVVAPGAGMVSSKANGGVGWAGSGTSLASPHAAGVIALMRSANPDILVDTARQIIIDTARDEGDPVGEYNTYGYGFIDAYEAVRLAKPLPGPSLNSPANHAVFFAPTNVTLSWAPLTDAMAYHVQISRNAAFTDLVYNWSNWTTSYTFTDPDDGLYYWRVRAYNDYNIAGEWSLVRDFSVITIVSCPVLFSHDGNGYREENPLLTACEASNYQDDVEDYYLVEHASPDGAGTLRFELRELEDEITRLQGLELLVVDAEAGAQVSCSVDGRVSSYRATVSPLSAVDHQGSDVLAALAEADGRRVHYEGPGSITLQFGAEGSALGFNFTGDRKPDCPIERGEDGPVIVTQDLRVEQLDANGNWVDLGQLPTREHLTQETVLLAPVDGQLTVRLSWKHNYEADQVIGFVPTERAPRVAALAVDAANFRPVDSARARAWSQVSAERPLLLLKGDVLAFSFADATRPAEGWERHYVLHAAGRYAPDPDAEKRASAFGSSLGDNFPNPFNPSTTISYQLPSAQRVTLAVYDESGRLVRSLVSATQAAGPHEVVWDGRDNRGSKVSSGIYFYRLGTDNQVLSRKMTLVK